MGSTLLVPFKNSISSGRLPNPYTGIPSTTAASFAFSWESMIPFNFADLALIAIDRVPLTGLILPSRESSPDMRYPLAVSGLIMPSAITMPSAIGRSNADPSFFILAGARLTVICFKGKLKPVFLRAVLTLSLLSLTAASGNPTVEKCGRPLAVTSTSTSTKWASIPINVALRILDNIVYLSGFKNSRINTY